MGLEWAVKPHTLTPMVIIKDQEKNGIRPHVWGKGG